MPQTQRIGPAHWAEEALEDGTPAEPQPSLDPGTRVGDYIVGDLIARGGFGVVYRASHRSGGGPSALKVLHAELASTQEAVRRFEREIQAIRRIDHPSVVAIFDFGQVDDGRPYFVMELLDGVDLEGHMRANGRVSPDEALSIFEPLCAALGAAHEKSIVHRDLKASNVFLTEREGARRVVLLDFGVAKLLDEAGPGLTTSRNMLGTPSCMAPEQITGRPADVRTDVYALGALAHHMLTGDLPFRDRSVIVMLHMHLYARPPCPSAAAPVSAVFDAVIARAMAKDPADRYPTAAAFLAAFRAAINETDGRAAPSADRSERRAIGLHVEVFSSSEDPDNLDPRMLADMEAVSPLATEILCSHGFELVLQTGNSMLLMADLSGDPALEPQRRRDAVAAALELHRALERRPERDARVHVNLCLHAGTAEIEGGAVVGGDLVALATWTPRITLPGVVGASAVFAGLDLTTAPASSSTDLVRVVDSPFRL